MIYKVDSRKVKKGDIFVALKEANGDGHKFIDDAIKNGASKIICEHGLYSVDTLVVKDTHEYLVNILKDEYGSILSNLKIIGVTGTNGKTTTCFCLHNMLNELGYKCGYIGTIGFYIKDKICNLNNTTPDILEIYEMLLKCYEEKCIYVVMEVSSHALVKKRVDKINFDYGIFTNLTVDHLDYHKTMENYALAKQKLFKNVTKKSIINVDSDYKDYFLINENSITYGFNKSDYNISNIILNSNESIFDLTYNDKTTTFKTNLLGKYNIYNLVCCIILLKEIGIKNDIIKQLVLNVTPPKGRMEIINYNDSKIIVDYAHTPDAVENILKSVKEFNKGKIYTIIGCGGNRDKTKRSKMAYIACNLSDYSIFTTDNPRNEKPENIINDMIQKLDTNNYEIIINRESAIEKGIQKLQKNDILLVLGKGHEDYQIINDKKIHFDDKEVIEKYIRR